MTEIEIKKGKDAIKLFEEKLTEAGESLDQRNQVSVERLTTLDDYKLNHPRGIYGLLFNGDVYTKREDVKNNMIYMKRDLIIGVVSITRYFDNPKVKVSSHAADIMMPFEYTELAIDTLSGIEVYNNRPENERKIYPGRTELVDEENGVWKYLTPFFIPLDYIEPQFRN